MEVMSGSMEMSMPLKEDFDFSLFPREGDSMARHAGTQAKHRSLVRRQKQERGERQGRGNRLGSAIWDHSCGLWAIGAVLSCLFPHLSLIQGKGTIGLVRVS